MSRFEAGRWGRFLSPDPYLGSMDAANPQSLNRYNYVGNNPLNGVDPLGLVCSANIGNDGPDSVCDPSNFGGGGGSGGNGLGGDYFTLINIPVTAWGFGPFYLNQTIDSWTFPGGEATARLIGGYGFGWFEIGTGMDLVQLLTPRNPTVGPLLPSVGPGYKPPSLTKVTNSHSYGEYLACMVPDAIDNGEATAVPIGLAVRGMSQGLLTGNTPKAVTSLALFGSLTLGPAIKTHNKYSDIVGGVISNPF